MLPNDFFDVLERLSNFLIVPILHYTFKAAQTISKLEAKVDMLHGQVRELLKKLLNN